MAVDTMYSAQDQGEEYPYNQVVKHPRQPQLPGDIHADVWSFHLLLLPAFKVLGFCRNQCQIIRI